MKKYLIIGLLFCVLSVGCAVIPPSVTKCDTQMDGYDVFVAKTGTSKGGGATGTVLTTVVDGKVIVLGAFTGRSTTEQVLGGAGAVGNGAGLYFVGRGLRKSGNSVFQQQGQIQ